ncbi:transposase [Singulisphaera sp. GP187]|uniref:transposase n=1 Tax=Singulisphaera sp. GP187 TaxID=1882752 RepID=UPI00135642F9|nr:transposase [Singulisphaera sp. GP187]
MPRTARVAPGGFVYHVLNRSAGKRHLFAKDADFEAFQRVMSEAHQRHPIRILAFAVLSNHWHFLVWPEEDGQLTEFFRWLTHTHAMRWRVAHRTVGYGPLYQGRFKRFPVQCDEHLLTVLRSSSGIRRRPGWSSGPNCGAGVVCR